MLSLAENKKETFHHKDFIINLIIIVDSDFSVINSHAHGVRLNDRTALVPYIFHGH